MTKLLFKLFLIAAICLNGGYTGFAQNKLAYTEFGLGVQTLNYSGDIATTTNVAALVSEVRPNFKVFGMRHFNDWFAMGAEVSYGWFYASDENHTNHNRGFTVYTPLTQANAFLEANFIRFGKYHFERKFGLYVKAGGGFLAYNPQVTFNNQLPENITPYTNSYSGTNFFFGLGMKLRTSYKSILRLEAAFHSTGMDHLDGFEYTDKPNDNDVYGGVMISYSILIF